MSDKYVLQGHQVVPEGDLLKWARRLETAERIVARDEVGEVTVSSVFLGLDYNFSSISPPLLFETMVFGGSLDGEQERYPTWEEAEAGHARWVEKVRGNH